MISQKPYFIRAIYEWCNDNNLTPYIEAYVNEKVQVPKEYTQNNHIVLNISLNATKDLIITNTQISFKTSFAGVHYDILIPIDNISSVFAKENHYGMQFNVELNQTESHSNGGSNNNHGGGGLKLIK